MQLVPVAMQPRLRTQTIHGFETAAKHLTKLHDAAIVARDRIREDVTTRSHGAGTMDALNGVLKLSSRAYADVRNQLPQEVLDGLARWAHSNPTMRELAAAPSAVWSAHFGTGAFMSGNEIQDDIARLEKRSTAAGWTRIANDLDMSLAGLVSAKSDVLRGLELVRQYG